MKIGLVMNVTSFLFFIFFAKGQNFELTTKGTDCSKGCNTAKNVTQATAILF